MKKQVLLVVLFVLGLAGTALALGPLGPPTAGLKKGQFSVAGEYAYSDSDVEVSGYGISGTLEGLTSNAFLGQLGYGITDEWELYGLVGAADHEVDDLDVLDFSYDFAYGFGTKFTFVKGEKVSWGALFEMGWRKGDDSDSIDLTDLTDGEYGEEDTDVDFDYYEIFVAVGPTWKVSECLSIYGGPFYYMLDGDLDIDLIGDSFSFDLEEESEFGGYVGVQWDLAPNTSWYGEFQFTGDMNVYATGISWKF